MAGNDTAALVVALSAQLTKFEKDMQGAVGIADKRTKEIENTFARVNGAAGQHLGQAAQSIGAALSGIGSSFLTAAGVAGLGLSALLATAIKLNGELAKIPGLARLAGISTDRLQEVKFAGAIKGVGDDAFVTSLDASVRLLDEAQRNVNTLTRLFNANGLSIKNQNGELIKFDQLLEIAAKLMVNARTEVEKFKIAEMLGLSREWVAALRDGPEAFRRNAAAAKDAGAVIDKETVERAKEFDKAWTEAIVRFKAGMTGVLSDLSNAFSAFWQGVIDSVPGASFLRDAVERWGGGLSRFTLPELQEILKRTIEQGLGDFEVARIQAAIDKKLGKEPLKVTVTPEVSEQPTIIPKDKEKNAFERAVFETNKRIAATDAETRTIAEQNDVRERAKVVAELEEAAKKANTDAGFQNATVTDLQRQKINELADAMQAAMKRQNESHAALAQFAVDGANFAKQFDQATIASLNNFGTALGDIVTGSKSASDAFRDLGKQVVRTITDMIIRMTILAPIAKALQATLSGGFGFGGGNFAPEFGYASGTDFAPGGMALVGERGPEIVNLPRGSQVIPNDVVRNAGGGGGDINVSLSMDLTGVNGEEAIARVAKNAAKQAFAAAVAVANAGLPGQQMQYRALKG